MAVITKMAAIVLAVCLIGMFAQGSAERDQKVPQGTVVSHDAVKTKVDVKPNIKHVHRRSADDQPEENGAGAGYASQLEDRPRRIRVLPGFLH